MAIDERLQASPLPLPAAPVATRGATAPAAALGVRRSGRTPLADSFQRLLHDRVAMFGLALVLGMGLAAIFAPALTKHDPLAQELVQRLKPPSAQHYFGTDNLGRDVFSRVLYGGRISMRVGLVSVVLGVAIGAFLGLLAGYGGRWADSLISRVMEIVLAFPSTLLAIAIVAARGPGIENTMVAVGIVSIPIYARLMRSSVIALKERDFV
ncbi:MAG TPA: ABC transporter permease, partial [Tepidisphaeraceae bacterium]